MLGIGLGERLPESDKEVVGYLNKVVEESSWRLWSRAVRWYIASLYIAGERKFQVRTPWGTIAMEETTQETGQHPSALGLLLSIYNRVVGLLDSMDVAPLVKRDDNSLPAVRDRAFTQVVLDSITDWHSLEDIRRKFCAFLTLYGGAGLHGDVNDYPNVGLTSFIEVVHPREIFPFPNVGANTGNARGIIRVRWVPKHVVTKLTKKRLDGAETSTGTPVELPSDLWTTPGERSEEHVRVKELWTYGSRGNVEEYVVSSGSVLLSRETYENVVAYPPLVYERFYESGDFWGAGLFDLLFTSVRELEKLVRDAIANVRELDRYATLVLPAGVVDERKFFQDNRQHLRVLMVDPEPKGVFGAQPQILRPVVVAPPTSGDAPQRASMFLTALIKDMSPVRDIVDDKGRVDSFAGLQFLREESTRPITVPAAAVGRAFGGVYRYCASRALAELVESPRPLPVGRISLDLVGAVIDVERNLMLMGPSTRMPDITRLRFTIRREDVATMGARKVEAMQLLQAGVKDRIDFLLYVVREGLEFAMVLDQERAAYESVVSNILAIVRDGETPGRAFLNPHMEYPEFQLRVLDAFLQSPVVRNFSAAVVNALLDYRELLLQWHGRMVPQMIPDPYTMGLMQQLGVIRGREGPGSPIPAPQGGTPPPEPPRNKRTARKPRL